MDYGDKFRQKASDTIAKFSTELGNSTLFWEVSDVYDTDTGLSATTYDEYYALMVFDDININEAANGSFNVPEPAQFIADHKTVLIAGLDLPPGVLPRANDLVKAAGTNTRHRVVLVNTDQYGALYTCYIARKPEDTP